MDLGDGFKAMYVNLTLTEEPIRHRYESPGVYRVSVRAENVAGHDEAVLFVQVTGEPIAPARPRAAPCEKAVLGEARGAQGVDPRVSFALLCPWLSPSTSLQVCSGGG